MCHCPMRGVFSIEAVVQPWSNDSDVLPSSLTVFVGVSGFCARTMASDNAERAFSTETVPWERLFHDKP